MIRLEILNGFEVHGVPSAQEKCRPMDHAVISVVAATSRPIHREELAEVLWDRPSTEASRKLHSLAQCLYRIGRAYPGLLRSTRNKSIVLAPTVTCDARELVDPRLRADAVLALTAPINLLRGLRTPSAGFEQWRDRTWAELCSIAYISLRASVRSASAAGNFDAVIEAGTRSVMHGPMCPEVATALVEAALAVHGERGAMNAVLDCMAQDWPHREEAARALDQAFKALPRASIAEYSGPDHKRLPLIGRQHEVELIASHIGKAERPVILQVSGERGIGKTRLLQELPRHRTIRDIRSFYVRCYPTQSHLPYGALADFFVGNLSASDWACIKPEDARAIANISEARDASTTKRRTPSRYRLAVRMAELARATSAILHSIGKGRQFIIIDDAMWLDHASASVLSKVLVDESPSIIAVVLAVRPDEVGTAAITLLMREVDHVDQLKLAIEPLSSRNQDELAQSLCKGLDENAVRFVASEGCGNPLLMSELAEATRRGSEGPSFSHRIGVILDARLNELTSTEAQVLEVVAVAGRPVSLAAVSTVARLDELAVRVAATELRRRGLVKNAREGDGVESFNAMITQHCRETIPKSRRHYIHHRLAQAAARDGRARALVADHLIQAEAGSSAVRECILAAKESLSNGSYETALYFLESATRLAYGTARFERVTLLYCDKLLEVGQLERAHPLLAELATPPLRGLGEYVQMLADLNSGRHSAATLLRTSVRLSQTADRWAHSSALVADCLGTTAELAAHAHDNAIMINAVERLASLAKSEPKPARAVEHAAMASRLACLTDGAADPVHLSDLSHSLSIDCGDPLASLRALLAQAAARWWAGRLRESRGLYDQAQLRCSDPGLVFFAWRVAVERSALLIDLGQAQVAARELVATISDCSDRERIYALANLGAAAFEMADADILERAGSDLERANGLAAPWVEAVSLSYRGYADLLRGRTTLAAQRRDRIIEILDTHRDISLNDPSYALLFCSRATEELAGPIQAGEMFVKRSRIIRSVPHVAKLRLDLEASRLAAAAHATAPVETLRRIENVADTAGAAAISQAARWLQRQVLHSRGSAWRRFVQATVPH